MLYPSLASMHLPVARSACHSSRRDLICRRDRGRQSFFSTSIPTALPRIVVRLSFTHHLFPSSPTSYLPHAPPRLVTIHARETSGVACATDCLKPLLHTRTLHYFSSDVQAFRLCCPPRHRASANPVTVLVEQSAFSAIAHSPIFPSARSFPSRRNAQAQARKISHFARERLRARTHA